MRYAQQQALKVVLGQGFKHRYAGPHIIRISARRGKRLRTVTSTASVLNAALLFIVSDLFLSNRTFLQSLTFARITYGGPKIVVESPRNLESLLDSTHATLGKELHVI